MKKENTEIVKLIPSQFDDYIFFDWKAPVLDLYDKFHIERIENYKNHLKLPLEPHKRSVYFFIFLTKGRVLRSKGLMQYEITPNQCFFLAAEQITSIEYVSEDAEGFYCHFLPNIFNQLDLKIDIQNDFPFFQIIGEPLLEISEVSKIKQLLEILESENFKNDTQRFSLIALYLYTLLTDFKFQVQPKNSIKNAASNLTQLYKNALSEFIYDKKTVSDFAEYLSVSPNHLHKCVKSITGKSAHQLLIEMRILEAKVLLRQSNFSIAEIAFKIGKFDPSDFARFFKSQTGISPKHFRLNN